MNLYLDKQFSSHMMCVESPFVLHVMLCYMINSEVISPLLRPSTKEKYIFIFPFILKGNGSNKCSLSIGFSPIVEPYVAIVWKNSACSFWKLLTSSPHLIPNLTLITSECGSSVQPCFLWISYQLRIWGVHALPWSYLSWGCTLGRFILHYVSGVKNIYK